MLLLYLLLFVQIVDASHYRGGTISYSIRANTNNMTINGQNISVLITQRHSWNRLTFFCNNTNPVSGDLIGEGSLNGVKNVNNRWQIYPSINTSVRCTDYSEEFQYSSGESSTTVLLPINDKIEYIYGSCCWISLLSPNSVSDWSLRFLINTHRRSDGTLNNSPKTTMNPVVQVELGKTHTISIPMADSDGDMVRCRWGNSTEECGTVCASKGVLRANPCELTYKADQTGYHAVALVIEDFDENNNVLSAIPLQFLIHIVTTTTITTADNCTELPTYIGERLPGSCIGIESNTTFSTYAQIRIPCGNTSITLKDILTVSPAGLVKGKIIRDSSDPSLYTMPIEWTPTPDQYGIHQLCLTPLDSKHRTGAQSCLTFQVDVQSPEIIQMSPIGLVSATHSTWTITFDRNIIKPKRANQVYVRFFKRDNDQEIVRIDIVTDVRVIYQPRQVTFFTNEYTWQQGEEYYILIDSGAGILNESCGVESTPISNSSIWIFEIEKDEPTTEESVVETTEEFVGETTEEAIVKTTQQFAAETTQESVVETTEGFVAETTKKSIVQTTQQPVVETTKEAIVQTTQQLVTETTKESVVETTEQSVTTQSSSSPRPECPRWFRFNRISNESTSLAEPNFTFCFSVETSLADVTIAANTWASCMTWKLSGTADPLLELYTEPVGVFLAQNDDGNSLPFQNCYAAVLSYRLQRGDYRVVIRSPKCSFGKFELRLSAEIDRNL